MASWGNTQAMEDVARLLVLPMSRDVNAMGVILEGEDEVKLRYLTSPMTASRTSGKSIYATSIRFSNEGGDNRSDSVLSF